jgi:Zn-dependent protease with chaperone function
MFIYGYGLFSDVWAPITEAIVSFIISIIGGHFWGLSGLLLGPIISLFLIVGLWKPYFLYRKGFKAPLRFYWLSILKFLVIMFFSWYISHYIILKLITINPVKNYPSWSLYAICVVIVFGFIEFIFMYIFERGMRNFFNRMKNRLLKKNKI